MPSAFDRAGNSIAASSFVTVTSAPAMMSPPGSAMRPEMVAVSAWSRRRHQEVEQNMIGRRERRELSRFVSPAGSRARSRILVGKDGEARKIHEDRYRAARNTTLARHSRARRHC
jgi:hypothetical protein